MISGGGSGSGRSTISSMGTNVSLPLGVLHSLLVNVVATLAH